MSHDFDTPRSYQQNKNLKKKWFSSYKFGASARSLDQTIESIKVLEKNNTFFKEMIVIYDIQEFKPLYVGNNVEKILGYSREEFLSWEQGAFLKIGAINQPDYFPNLSKWIKEFNKSIPKLNAGSLGRFHLCGVRYKHKDESFRRFLVRQEIVVNPDFTMPKFAILFYEDITHLIKGEDYWMLLEGYDDKQSFTKFYRKAGTDNYPITAREKEVLKLIATGKSTKEVAKELNISPDTVSQHRKNMVKRTMAKDSSSLIQLCKICEII